MKCMKCENEMEVGYSSANTPLSWIKQEKFELFAFADEDLAKAGLKSLFPWKGEYFKAYNCEKCKLISIDYSQKKDRKSIKEKS